MDRDDPNNNLKSRRDQYKVEIRKEKNEELFMKSRSRQNRFDERVLPCDEAQMISEESGTDKKHYNYNLEQYEQLCNIKEKFMHSWNSQNLSELEKVVYAFRTCISVTKNPPIHEFLDLGLVSYFLELLQPKFSGYFELQYEISWAISNVCSADYQHLVELIKQGLLETLINLLNDQRFFENVFWAFSNLIGESLEIRNVLIDRDIISVFFQAFNSIVGQKSVGAVRVSAWFISNLCRGNPFPDFQKISCFLPILAQFVDSCDSDTCCETLWALTYLTTGDENQISKFLQQNKLPRICELMLALDNEVSYPAFRIVGNLLAGCNFLDIAIRSGCLKGLKFLIAHKKQKFRKEVCWATSNLLAGNSDIIQKVIDESNIFQKLTMILIDDYWEVKREATFCLYNATYSASPSQMEYFMRLSIPEVLFQNLHIEEPSLKFMTLKTLYNFFEFGKKMQFVHGYPENQFVKNALNIQYYELLEQLQTHLNPDISSLAQLIITEYCETSDELVLQQQI